MISLLISTCGSLSAISYLDNTSNLLFPITGSAFLSIGSLLLSLPGTPAYILYYSIPSSSTPLFLSATTS